MNTFQLSDIEITRQKNLEAAIIELDLIKEEFSKVTTGLTTYAFNKLCQNNSLLASIGIKYFKPFNAMSFSNLFNAIKNYELISCGNPLCSNVTSTMMPNCSRRCKANNPQEKEKRKNTCLEKYGVVSSWQAEEVRAKVKKTYIEKFGVSHPMLINEVKEKAKKTRLEKYGFEYSHQCPEVQLKLKATNLERYGVEHASQSPVIKAKVKASNFKKYGVECPFQAVEVKSKIIATSTERYGVKYACQAEQFGEKRKNTCLERYGVEHNSQVPEVQQKTKKTIILKKWDLIVSNPLIRLLISKEEFKSGAELRIKCSSCSSQVEYPRFRCFDCYPLRTNFEQNEVRDYIISLGFEVIENSRTIIKNDESNRGQEIDILIPSKKIGIEYNGIYWHSEGMGTPANYHMDKTAKATSAGYKLIHLFSDQWKSRQEIVKKRLRHILGLETRTVYARKCHVEEISPAESTKFLIENHIQGASNARIKLALKYEDEIVAVMTFSKPRFNKNYDYEMIRFATSCNVPGGASKLLTAFKKLVPSASIITYADKSWSNGDLYRLLGFTELKDSAPSYFWTNEKETYKRYETMKHKLSRILENFDPKLSESENMKRNKFDKIYDCGNKVFELKY